ncbi:nitrate- and nitrite sensing domain-containing protein [Actinophytocola sp.]|uniref:sensor histidine kinase n=1 Tax=Actinophytocola sp. TaxID=1872138 RepID=UPI002ED37B07
MKPATEPTSRWAALLSVLANWRDWTLPVKLAAATLVPVVFAVVLGTMQISDQVDEACAYRRIDRLVMVNEKLRELVAALQTERGTAGRLLAAGTGDVVSRTAGEWTVTDEARAEFLRAAGRVTLDHEAAAARYADVLTRLDGLTALRGQVARPGFEAATAVAGYSAVIDALLLFDRTTPAEALDPTLASTASALHDIEVIKEEVAHQQSVIAVGIVRGGLTRPEVDTLAVSLRRQADRSTDFHNLAGARLRDLYDDRVSDPSIASRDNVVAAAVAQPEGTPVPTTAQGWADGSALTTKRLGEVTRVLAADMSDRSAALQDEASDGAGLAAVILLVALVVALGVLFVVCRHLLGSLTALLHGALDVAERALPEAVARIREQGEHAIDLEPSPVRITSIDEMGQLARAFDAVRLQALRLATEQAGLRARYADVFVNLSRRSQGLVQRQLRLLERLERDEEDPDQLATLFQLDHLATRMRRNNENLMVLSGGEVSRRSQRPASLADLLRASVSEIEQYQRVVLLPPPSVEVVGYAVGDLVRLVAELLDNATAFSAPDTPVTIASHAFEDGSLCVAVHDEGIGMSQEELDEANAKLGSADLAVDVSTSRRMGLFVVGRLAGRLGVEVRLNRGHDMPGVRATVTVPAELVSRTVEPPPERVRKTPTGTSLLTPFSPHGQAIVSVNGTNKHTDAAIRSGLTPSPLPRREQEELSEFTSGGLPRRSPGENMPGPKPGEPTGGLFTPADANAVTERSAVEETTPIFDEMVSAWFRAVTEPGEPTRLRPPREDDLWNFAADSGFDAARAVSRAEPVEYTSGGLPRRSPRQHLVPGSAAPASDPSPPGHEADELRNRLGDYRQGVRKARGHRRGVDPPSIPTAPVTPTQQSTSDDERYATRSLPRRTPGQNLVPGSDHERRTRSRTGE